MSASFFSEKDPFVHFQNLFQEAQKLIPKDPNAMQIATVDSLGQPSVRTVLMKGIDQGGFTFFTNYQSPKSQNIENNQKVALNFYWPELNTQVRVIGIAQKVSSQESDNYFSVRPRLSQLGAWASQQSRPIPNLDFLINKVEKYDDQFKNQNVPRPAHWGGFRIFPREIEFWFSKEGRLHERYVYFKKISPQAALKEIQQAPWEIEMRSP